MRIHQALALIGAATLSFAASAAPAATSDVASVSVAGVAAHYKATDSELAGVKGSYALNDGRTLRVSANNYHVFAEVDGQKTEIVPVAPHVFASRDDALRLTFDDSAFATDVKVSVPAR